MRNHFFFFILLACAMVACKPKPDAPKPEAEEDVNCVSLQATKDLFPNPERGFHQFKEFFSPEPVPMTKTSVEAIHDLGFTLVLTNYFLTDYMSTPIPDSFLDVVRQNMQALREGGCKCVIRFSYINASEPVQDKAPYEAPLDTILLHISQLKPILQENADVIFAMEAGFIGFWGEWYYTNPKVFKRNPTKDSDFVPYRQVLDALLDALPKERQICVRTPKFKMRCYGWTMADTLTRAEAFTGTPKARLAGHDDAFMANSSDMGTFAGDRAYWAAESKYTIYGGESNKPGDYANCTNTINQMLEMHMSYLNISYHKGVISGWDTQGCLDDIRRQLGYRFEGRDVSYPKNPKAGEPLKVQLRLVNVGFSAPKNPRDIEMLLVNTADANDVYRVVPNTDPRFWYTDEMQTIEVSFKPQKAGEYKLYLNLPDPQPTLHNNPRYSIRLANENCWEENTGYNYLTTINVE